MILIIAKLMIMQSFAATGFKNGNQLEVTPAEGIARVWCYNGNQQVYRQFSCYTEYVHPGLKDKIQSDEAKGAKKITLTSTWDSGKVVEKTQRFDSEKGESKASFNLWIRTLTQKPLLGPGQNRIDYQFKDTKVKGTFFVDVNIKQSLSCKPMALNFRYDCLDRYRICNDYFYFNRSCN